MRSPVMQYLTVICRLRALFGECSYFIFRDRAVKKETAA